MNFTFSFYYIVYGEKVTTRPLHCIVKDYIDFKRTKMVSRCLNFTLGFSFLNHNFFLSPL